MVHTDPLVSREGSSRWWGRLLRMTAPLARTWAGYPGLGVPRAARPWVVKGRHHQPAVQAEWKEEESDGVDSRQDYQVAGAVRAAVLQAPQTRDVARSHPGEPVRVHAPGGSATRKLGMLHRGLARARTEHVEAVRGTVRWRPVASGVAGGQVSYWRGQPRQIASVGWSRLRAPSSDVMENRTWLATIALDRYGGEERMSRGTRSGVRGSAGASIGYAGPVTAAPSLTLGRKPRAELMGSEDEWTRDQARWQRLDSYR